MEGTGGGPNQNKTLIQNSRLSQSRFEVSTYTTQIRVITALANSTGDIPSLAHRYVNTVPTAVVTQTATPHLDTSHTVRWFPSN